MDIGYARISTRDQTLDLQLDALAKTGCDKVFTKTASGAGGGCSRSRAGGGGVLTTADPQRIKRILDYRGIDVRLDGDRLIARPRSGPLSDDMVRFIRHFKSVIIAELGARKARLP